MTLAIVAGAVCAIAISLLVRPFLGPARPRGLAAAVPTVPVDDGLRQLLRQVRDLDDDLAVGKLTTAEHGRLRGVLEGQLAPLLREASAVPGETVQGPRRATSRRTRWLRRVAAVLALGTALAGAGVLLRGAVEPRTAQPGATTQAVAPADPSAAKATPDPMSQPGALAMEPTAADLAAVDRAVARVRMRPASVGAHLDLAHAYTGAGQPQLATVEYLAVTRLDRSNAEANTALALIAFTSGNAQDAKELVDRALSRRPGYAEALYVRGLVQAMGLKNPAAARPDFEAYLEAAPFGAHRDTVETLLRLIDEGGPK